MGLHLKTENEPVRGRNWGRGLRKERWAIEEELGLRES